MGIRRATFFHSRPHSVSPSRKAWCSPCVHRPEVCPFDFEEEAEPLDPLRFLLLLDLVFFSFLLEGDTVGVLETGLGFLLILMELSTVTLI